MWAKRKNHAVSEIVGTVMLLGMAVAMFTLVQIFAFGLLTENQNSPSVRLVAFVEDRNITIVHNGGEQLPLTTKILCTVNDTPLPPIIADDNITDHDNDFWEIGEKVEYNPIGYENLDTSKVEILVVDVVSNYVIMRTIIRG